MLRRDWDNFLYDVADFFFAKQMDKAYDQGIRIGAEYAARNISMSVITAGDNAKLTKAQQVGYDLAREAIRKSKKEIHAKTGAML